MIQRCFFTLNITFNKILAIKFDLPTIYHSLIVNILNVKNVCIQNTSLKTSSNRIKETITVKLLQFKFKSYKPAKGVDFGFFVEREAVVANLVELVVPTHVLLILNSLSI